MELSTFAITLKIEHARRIGCVREVCWVLGVKGKILMVDLPH